MSSHMPLSAHWHIAALTEKAGHAAAILSEPKDNCPHDPEDWRAAHWNRGWAIGRARRLLELARLAGRVKS